MSFRDESEAVIEKIHRKAQAKEASRLEPASSARAGGTHKPLDTSAASALVNANVPPKLHDSFGGLDPNLDFLPTFTLLPTIEDQGLNYFLSNFVKTPTGPSHGYFSYTYDVLCDEGSDDLQVSLVAVGIAGIANHAHDADLMRLARRKYAIALQKINTA